MTGSDKTLEPLKDLKDEAVPLEEAKPAPGTGERQALIEEGIEKIEKRPVEPGY